MNGEVIVQLCNCYQLWKLLKLPVLCQENKQWFKNIDYFIMRKDMWKAEREFKAVQNSPILRINLYILNTRN